MLRPIVAIITFESYSFKLRKITFFVPRKVE